MLKLGMNIVEMDESGVEIGFEAVPPTEYFGRNSGQKRYELSNHTSTLLSAGLGNTLVTVTDKKVYVDGSSGIEFEPEITTISDYYPYGAPIASRAYSIVEYRYGFNGQELENEINGDGNVLSATFWEYDTRLARRWNIDPVDKEFESSYACFAGNPVLFADPNGDDAAGAIVGMAVGTAVGAYIGGAVSNNSWNPGSWEWDKNTGISITVRAVLTPVFYYLPSYLNKASTNNIASCVFAGLINAMYNYHPDNTVGLSVGYFAAGYAPAKFGMLMENSEYEEIANTALWQSMLGGSKTNLFVFHAGQDVRDVSSLQVMLGGALVAYSAMSMHQGLEGSKKYKYLTTDYQKINNYHLNSGLTYGLLNFASNIAFTERKYLQKQTLFNHIGIFFSGFANGIIQQSASDLNYEKKNGAAFFLSLYGNLSEYYISTSILGYDPFNYRPGVRKVSIGSTKSVTLNLLSLLF